ncbi:MAG TPA: Na+/H+ antiporter NhaC family protein [Planctomycetota bacterium]|nr:Na+/H+ antiporter NhaC family protein [Planctomycetota bacterium]
MNRSPAAAPAPRTPSVAISLLPVLALVGLLALNVLVFESADNQVVLLAAAAFAAVLAKTVLKRPWADLEDGVVKAVASTLQACFILMTVGMLIAVWVKAGVVPLMVVLGLKLISPAWFLLTACVVCCVISSATGSSWTTAGTVGVALVHVGGALGVDPGMAAGAVVSGAYFGDKMSPLSDTTNLAPAMAGATLLEHVRHMFWTVTPALVLALAGYAFLGGKHDGAADALAGADAVRRTLEANFPQTLVLLAPPALVLLLILRRVGAIPALLAGTAAAAALGVATGGPAPLDPAEGVDVVLKKLPPGLAGYLKSVDDYLAASFNGSVAPATLAAPSDLSEAAATVAQERVIGLVDGKGGMKGMMGTVALIFCALAFGGVMERSGMLGALASAILRLVRGTGSLIAAVVFTCFGVNVLASDQYMSIVVPGRMFRRAFLDRGLHPKNLSRALEDSGTVTSALIPWNTCGAQMSTVLGVGAAVYAPYAFLNWLCPLVSIVYGVTGFTIARLAPDEAAKLREA